MSVTALTIIFLAIIVITIALFYLRDISSTVKTFEYEPSSVFLNLEKCALLDTLEHALTDPECTPAFLTQKERSLLKALELSITDRYRVFCKVRLKYLVSFPNQLLPSHKHYVSNSSNNDPVDYLVCEYPNLNVLGVVVLDNPFEATSQKYLFKQILTSADIPVAIFTVDSDYDLGEVRSILINSFPISLVSDHQSTKQDATFSTTTTPVASSRGAIQPVAIEKNCPKCSSKMIKRQVTKGPHKGKFFWACMNFSSCKQLLAIHEKTSAESTDPACIACGAEMVRLRVNKGPHTGKFFWACSAYPACRYMTAR